MHDMLDVVTLGKTLILIYTNAKVLILITLGDNS
jgi:hypothetical protein